MTLAIGCSLQPVSTQTVSNTLTISQGTIRQGTIRQSIISQAPPNPPPSPPPNDTRPGGGLGPQDALSCNSLNRSVRALLPVTNPVLTTTNSPTFLFYIPFAADQIRVGEFTLLTWPGEEQRLHQVRFTLPQTPGIVSVTLPPQTGLQEGNSYRWYFQIYCKDGTGTQPDLTVNGMVQRTALTPERERRIRDAMPDVWYDALAQVAAQLQRSPQDAQLREKWRSLLQIIEAEDLVQERIVGAVTPLPPSSQQ